MPANANYNKLINQAAKTVLKKEGLFQKGSSRIWIDDNGWYLIVVEFQPSNWERGSYLNVGIHYLWDEKGYLSFDYGHRVGGFVRFAGNDEKFYADMQSAAETAMQKVMEYRQFAELTYAQEMIIGNEKAQSKTRGLYNNMMICGLCQDSRAVEYFDQLLCELQFSQIGWEKAYYRELSEKIAPIIQDTARMRSYICNKIACQRDFWRAKSGMKKLREDD